MSGGRGDWSPSGARLWWLIAAAVAAGTAAAGATHPEGLLHGLGILPRTPPSTTYAWWSGPAGVLEAVVRDIIIIGLLVFHTNCHARDCWRRGRYPVEGTPYKACGRHHPHVPDGGATAEQIQAAHTAARQAASPPFGEPHE